VVARLEPGDPAIVYGVSIHSLMYYARRQTVVAHDRTSHAFASRLPDAEEPRRASVDHAVEYRFGADASSPRG